jgi:hypothetical protein
MIFMRSARVIPAFILSAACLAVLASGPAAANPPARAQAPATQPSRQPSAAMSAQKQLAGRLRAIKGDSIADALNHNRAEWSSLSPDQRSRFRREALAFLSRSPDQQDRLLRQYQRLVSLSAERQENYRRIAQWLSAVVGSMSADERKAMLEMSPQQRAKALLDRKAELIAKGKLPPDRPATQPAGDSRDN